MKQKILGVPSCAYLLPCILLCLGLFVTGARAETGGPKLTRDERNAPPAGSGQRGYMDATVGVHGFTGDEMKDAYGQMYGGNFQYGRLPSQGVGWRLETGIWIATGQPGFPDDSWTVESSEMQTAVAPLGGTILYRFSGGEGRAFMPHVGFGADGYFGFERTSVKISRPAEGAFDWNDTQFRKTFGLHALLGGALALTDQVSGVIEVRWTLGFEGSTVEQSFSEVEIIQGWLEAAKAVQRPDYDFTGWNVTVGLQW